MRVKLSKIVCVWLLSFLISGCYDPYFRIRGEIYIPTTSSYLDNSERSKQKIPNVAVSIRCKGFVSQPLKDLKVLSNIEGFYQIQGIGTAEECELIFEHPNFKPKIVKIEPELHKDPSQKLKYGYKVNVELEPLSKSE